MPDPLTIDLQQGIFWAAYYIDRSICAALQRPFFYIPDPAINAQVMSILPNKCITPIELVNHSGGLLLTQRLRKYCRKVQPA